MEELREAAALGIVLLETARDANLELRELRKTKKAGLGKNPAPSGEKPGARESAIRTLLELAKDETG